MEQRGSRVESSVREMVEPETHPSHIAGGGSGASQQSAPHLRERVFARVDRGSVVVHRVIPGPIPTYKIREWDGSPVDGTFYNAHLQKVQLADDALFRIEKVLKRQKGQMFVKWQGWPDKDNSWIPSQALTTTTTTQKKTRKRKRP